MDGSNQTYQDCRPLDRGTEAPASVYGARASSVVSLFDAGLPVPRTWAFSAEAVRRFSRSDFGEDWPLTEAVQSGLVVAVRASPQVADWGGPEPILNIGMNDEIRDRLSETHGAARANALYFRFIQDFSVAVARLDAAEFDDLMAAHTSEGVADYPKLISDALVIYQSEMDDPFPQDPMTQLRMVLRAMSVGWNSASARILREAKGAPSDAGLALIVQEIVLGLGQGEYGAGIAQFVHASTGHPQAFGRYMSRSFGFESLEGTTAATFLAKDPRGTALEDIAPEAFARLMEFGAAARQAFGDEQQLEFSVEDNKVWILSTQAAQRSGRAAVQIAVDLEQDGLISKKDALMQIAPRSLNEILHPQIHAKAQRDIFALGIGASPGAATGKMVFSANAAQLAEARGETCILVRFETSPDDIRGMHSANGVLTEKGGITSHAAVVARGIGLPCVVGASGIGIDAKINALHLADGSILREGDVITLDGSTGEVMRGAPTLVEPDLGGAFHLFMSWADEYRTMGVRGNADTPNEVRIAKAFGVDGIGLVRTEHMFFEEGRLNVMRELIFSESEEGRTAALSLLLPMQRKDFFEIFAQMGEQPVCIRLLDPPLHEFLPNSRAEMQLMAEAMNLPLSKVVTRVEELSEFNPMLGTRGVRLGVTVPEIYEMQMKAIMEAALNVRKTCGFDIEPEIMIPLVSANKEVEIIKSRVDAVASIVQAEYGETLAYQIGVMVETPRAALRADEIAKSAEFFSFGTNDLTQMTYGLSRDDAGRFMREYVNLNVFEEDPFHSLDISGVGELLKIAADRGRKQRPNLKIGLCGEHGGDPASVNFCNEAGFDYVSCSAFRAPIARLSAAQSAITSRELSQIVAS